MGAASKTGQVKFLVQGEQGPSGARQRYVDWSTTSDFLSGTNGEEWQYTTYYNTHAYLCLRSFNKSTYSKTPAQSVADNDGYFVVADEFFFAVISYLIVNKLNAAMIDVDSLVVKMLETATSGPRINITGAMMEVYGNSACNIRSGVDENGLAILQYFDNEGRKLYDLGPEGIKSLDKANDSWSSYRYKYLGLSLEVVLQEKNYKECTYSECVLLYTFHSGYIGDLKNDAANDGKIFTTQSKDTPANGWYIVGVQSVSQDYATRPYNDYTGEYGIITSGLPGMSSHNESILYREGFTIYYVQLIHIINGTEQEEYVAAYWSYNNGSGGISEF